jgi:hypothetical protein
MGKLEERCGKEEPFVRREDSAGLAQTKQSEEVNLLNMIEIRIKNLMQSLNAIESLTNNLNKNLLPMSSVEDKGKVEAKKPQGYLENHIANLEHLISRAEQIHYQVVRLTKATQINKVDQ